MGRRGEFDIIARHFAPLSRNESGAFGLTDDVAHVSPSRRGLVVTADAIVSGVHFLPDDPPDTIARKLLRVSISDVVAKGALPNWYMLTAAFPKDIGERWIAAFARGLKADQACYGLTLIGGDTVATPGPLTLSATVLATAIGRLVLRSGAMPGDVVCVTGSIGDAGLGLEVLRGRLARLSPVQQRFLVARYRIPQPRIRFAPHIGRLATAALDVSDGLVQDLEHIAENSGVRIVVNAAQVPRSPAARAADAPAERLLAAGDDYEIAFTLPRRKLDACRAAARESRTKVTVIGHVEAGAPGVDVLNAAGDKLTLENRGFDHFRQ